MSRYDKPRIPVLEALLAAALYGISIPLSKQLLSSVPPMMAAAFLYLGAGLGMLALDAGKRILKAGRTEAGLARSELPYIILMVALDIAAPICLMLGLKMTAAANASLLSNFEIVATSVIALAVFRESIGSRQWIAIALVTVSSILLSFEDMSAFRFSPGSLLVILACVCWGFENNCSRKLSLKNPAQIVIVKGLGSGAGALGVALLSGERFASAVHMAFAMLLGFVSYGLSIYFYVRAQRELGAARTSAFYAVAPFIGAGVAIIAFGERMTGVFAAAAVVMLAGAWLSVTERHSHEHVHEPVAHEHRHSHDDGHHNHTHREAVNGGHSHYHEHERMKHTHEHRPDMHHQH